MLFKNSQTAMAFGEKANQEGLEAVKRALTIYQTMFENRMQKSDKTLTDLDEMSRIATNAQFCHEALEAARLQDRDYWKREENKK